MENTEQALFRALPSIDALLAWLGAKPVDEEPWLKDFPRPFLRELSTLFLDQYRIKIRNGEISRAELDLSVLLPTLLAFIRKHGEPHFCRVVNASGVIVHTNLGRSILAAEAVQAAKDAAAFYSNLEFNLETGRRGSRYSHVEGLLCQLTGAEAAFVVNNNAAAVFLMLDTLCKQKEVIVSRGELVEIGGSFRIPEIMAQSGCFLHEVGTTNRTHLADYTMALNENTAALMKVHSSNFRMIGFVAQADRKDLTQLARERGLLALEDLGSGSLLGSQDVNGTGLLSQEPDVRAVLASGMDVVSFSGDKVLGGPQAGVLVGKRNLLEQMKKNPLTRALRIDKLTLAALEATLRLYLDPVQAVRSIPTLRMLHLSIVELEKKSRSLARRIRVALARRGAACSVMLMPGSSKVGGGAFPEYELPTSLVCLDAVPAEDLRKVLLEQRPALVGRIEKDMFCLDPRTLQSFEYSLVAELIAEGCVIALRQVCR